MSFKDNYPLTPPTLSLDFVNSATIDPRVTFSRSSKATYYNPAGLLTVADVNVPRIDYDPITHECKGLLIEESRTNLLTYSEQFDNAAWTKSNSSVLTNLLTYSQEFDNASWVKTNATVTANAIAAPDGTTTADKLVESTVNGYHYTQNNISVVSATTYTFSVYVKAGEDGFVNIQIGGGLGSSTGVSTNLTTGVQQGYNGASTYSATYIANGWFRISLTVTAIGTGVGSVLIVTSKTLSTNATYTGDGTSGIYIWGAQLVQGTDPGEYTVTTSAPAPIQVTSPLGFVGAQKLVENTAASVPHGLAVDTSSLSPTTQYTFSVYAKAGERTWVRLGLVDNLGTDGGRAWFDLSNGVVGTVETNGAGSNINATINSIGAGWYRCRFTAQMNNSKTTLQSQVRLATANNVLTYTGDGTSGIYIWGAQLEAGSFPTSYIPTTSAQVTRAADNASMVGTNFSSWYNQSEGTVSSSFDINGVGSSTNYNGIVCFDDGSINNAIELSMWDAAGDSLRWVGYVANTPQWSIYPKTYSSGVSNGAGGYQINNFNAAFDGILGTTDNSGSIPTVNIMRIGTNRGGNSNYLNGHIKSIKYYPIRLTNAQLQTLTNP